MDAFEAIITRRSIRKYKKIPVEVEKIGMLIEAGRYAPTAGNLQPFKFIIVVREEQRKAIAEACLQQYWMETAPLHIVVVSEPWKSKQFYGSRGEKLYSIQNCAAAVENILITATSVGLGSCWVSAFEENMLRDIVGVPEEKARPQAVVTIGYPDEVVPVPQKYRFYDRAYLNVWDQRITDLEKYFGYFGRRTRRNVEKGIEFLKKATERLQKKG